MLASCHRCGQDLPGDTVRGFCPHCGAPQILLSSELAPAATLETAHADSLDSALDPAPRASTGAAPPPHPAALGSGIVWPTVLPLAAVVSLGAVLLFLFTSAVPRLAPLGFFALVSVASVVTGLYSRRAVPPLTARTGAQVGLATGLLLVAMLTAVLAAGGLFARFRLGIMGPFDVQWTNQLQVLADRTVAQARAGGVDPADALRTLHSPEFRAWAMLAGLGLGLGFLLALTTAAGAIAGLFRAHRPPSLQP